MSWIILKFKRLWNHLRETKGMFELLPLWVIILVICSMIGIWLYTIVLQPWNYMLINDLSAIIGEENRLCPDDSFYHTKENYVILLNFPIVVGIGVNSFEYRFAFLTFLLKACSDSICKPYTSISDTSLFLNYLSIFTLIVVGSFDWYFNAPDVIPDTDIDLNYIYSCIIWFLIILITLLLYGAFITDSIKTPAESGLIFLWFVLAQCFLILFTIISLTQSDLYLGFVLGLTAIYLFWWLYLYTAGVTLRADWFYFKHTINLIQQHPRVGWLVIEFYQRTIFARSLVLWLYFIVTVVLGTVFSIIETPYFIRGIFIVYAGLCLWLTDLLFTTKINLLRLLLIPFSSLLRLTFNASLRMPLSPISSSLVVQNQFWWILIPKRSLTDMARKGVSTTPPDGLASRALDTLFKVTYTTNSSVQIPRLITYAYLLESSAPRIIPSKEALNRINLGSIYDVPIKDWSWHSKIFNIATSGLLRTRGSHKYFQYFLESGIIGYYTRKFSVGSNLGLIPGPYVETPQFDYINMSPALGNEFLDIILKFPFLKYLGVDNEMCMQNFSKAVLEVVHRKLLGRLDGIAIDSKIKGSAKTEPTLESITNIVDPAWRYEETLFIGIVTQRLRVSGLQTILDAILSGTNVTGAVASLENVAATVNEFGAFNYARAGFKTPEAYVEVLFVTIFSAATHGQMYLIGQNLPVNGITFDQKVTLGVLVTKHQGSGLSRSLSPFQRGFVTQILKQTASPGEPHSSWVTAGQQTQFKKPGQMLPLTFRDLDKRFRVIRPPGDYDDDDV